MNNKNTLKSKIRKANEDLLPIILELKNSSNNDIVDAIRLALDLENYDLVKFLSLYVEPLEYIKPTNYNSEKCMDRNCHKLVVSGAIKELSEYLKNNKVSANQLNSSLAFASFWFFNMDIVKLLLAHGATAKGVYSESGLESVRENWNKDVLAMLDKLGRI